MKKENEKLISVCVYCNSTGLFSEEECNLKNLTDMMFPEWIVREWYKKNEKDFIEECKIDSLKEPCFETWLNEVYIADDTDGLYDFAVEKGFDPVFDMSANTQDAVVYENLEYETVVVFTGDYLECRKWAREHDWKFTIGYSDTEVDLDMLFH